MRTFDNDELNELIIHDPAAMEAALGAPLEWAEALSHLRALCPWCDPRYTYGDMGNGYLFADYYRRAARFVQGRRRWYLYDGRVWKPDADGTQVMELCRRLIVMMMELAPTVEDNAQREVFLRRVTRLQGRTAREKLLRDAAGVHPLQMAELDAKPLLLNCLNGTLELDTFTFREHRAEDLLTSLAGAAYLPGARCERWESFMTQITAPAQPPETLGPDEGETKKQYLQKAMGYALTGLTQHECLFILYGATTRNGKGTAMETLLTLMGDYGRATRPETIGSRPSGSAPTEDIARLHGARFVSVAEPERGLSLSAGLVKTLTGNDTINARYLNENSFDYRPQFKLFINTNHLPHVCDETLFASGRIKTIPFERHFADHEQDKTLKWQFAQPENLSGILNWCLDGLRLLNAEGFREPECVRLANESYRRRSDVVGMFVENRLVAQKGARLRSSQVYAAYRNWCAQSGYEPMNLVDFRQEMTRFALLKKGRIDGGSQVTSLILGYCLLNME